MPFWKDFCKLLKDSYGISVFDRFPYEHIDENASDNDMVQNINSLADEVSRNMAIAITNTGQILFLFRISGEENTFGDFYTLYWHTKSEPWILRTNNLEYVFQLPDEITKVWLSKASSEIDLKIGTIECKTNFLSNMVVYYKKYNKPVIKMISIDEYELKKAKDKIFPDKQS